MAQSVSAVLLSLKGAAGFNLEIKYNRQGNQATFAWPVAATLASFFDKMNWFASPSSNCLCDCCGRYFDGGIDHALFSK